MQNWMPVIGADRGPKYAAIADAIAGAVKSGDLRPGQRLPPQREMARVLGVDLTTVTKAYDLARKAGLIEGAGKLGSFVRNDVALPRFGETASELGMNVPPQPAFNLLPEAIRIATASLLRAGRHSPILQYQPSLGNLLDRGQAAAWMSGRGMETEPGQVVIAAGAQHALHSIIATALQAGDRICTGRFVYPGLLSLARRYRLALDVVDTDKEGLLPESLAQRLERGARFVYITPTNDNPTTATMGIARRKAIAAVIERHGAILIEDDAYGMLSSRNEPACASFLPGHSWYIASTSKTISPIIRIAHVRAPSAGRARSLAVDISETAIMAPPLNAAIVTTWLRDGTFDEIVAGVRAEAVARQRIAARHLLGARYQAHGEGYHLWLGLDRSMNVDDLVQTIAAQGLSIVSGDMFDATGAGNCDHVRISLGGAIDRG